VGGVGGWKIMWSRRVEEDLLEPLFACHACGKNKLGLRFGRKIIWRLFTNIHVWVGTPHAWVLLLA
jgi:hypothetical protein